MVEILSCWYLFLLKNNKYSYDKFCVDRSDKFLYENFQIYLKFEESYMKNYPMNNKTLNIYGKKIL